MAVVSPREQKREQERKVRQEWRNQIRMLWPHRHADSPIAAMIARNGIKYAVRQLR